MNALPRMQRSPRKAFHVQFAELRDGKAVYRDAILADSVPEAIESRFRLGGKLPDNFVVEKVTALR